MDESPPLFQCLTHDPAKHLNKLHSPVWIFPAKNKAADDIGEFLEGRGSLLVNSPFGNRTIQCPETTIRSYGENGGGGGEALCNFIHRIGENDDGVCAGGSLSERVHPVYLGRVLCGEPDLYDVLCVEFDVHSPLDFVALEAVHWEEINIRKNKGVAIMSSCSRVYKNK